MGTRKNTPLPTVQITMDAPRDTHKSKIGTTVQAKRLQPEDNVQPHPSSLMSVLQMWCDNRITRTNLKYGMIS